MFLGKNAAFGNALHIVEILIIPRTNSSLRGEFTSTDCKQGLNYLVLVQRSHPSFFPPLPSVESFLLLLGNNSFQCFALGNIFGQQCFVFSSSALPRSWAPSKPSREPAKEHFLVIAKCHFWPGQAPQKPNKEPDYLYSNSLLYWFHLHPKELDQAHPKQVCHICWIGDEPFRRNNLRDSASHRSKAE